MLILIGFAKCILGGKLADFADFFDNIGHKLDDVLNVRWCVLVANGNVEAACGLGRD